MSHLGHMEWPEAIPAKPVHMAIPARWAQTVSKTGRFRLKKTTSSPNFPFSVGEGTAAMTIMMAGVHGPQKWPSASGQLLLGLEHMRRGFWSLPPTLSCTALLPGSAEALQQLPCDCKLWDGFQRQFDLIKSTLVCRLKFPLFPLLSETWLYWYVKYEILIYYSSLWHTLPLF